MFALDEYVQKSGLEQSLRDLVNIRASQLNGCAFCLDMHSREARLHGESEQRLYALSEWRDTRFFTRRERAALAWTETVTLVAETHVPEAVYREALANFTEKELVDLTMAVIAINGRNRIGVAFRMVPENMPKAVPLMR